MPRELSRKPNRIRDRLRRGTDPGRDLAMLGVKPLAEWDLEELGRGVPRDSSGSFSGRRTPSWLVGPLQEERHRRLKQGAYDGLMAHTALAMETIGKLIKDSNTPASVRADLAKFLYEQLQGKAAAQVNVGGRMEVHTILAAAIVLDDGQPQDDPIVLEGEYTAEEHQKDQRLADYVDD